MFKKVAGSACLTSKARPDVTEHAKYGARKYVIASYRPWATEKMGDDVHCLRKKHSSYKTRYPFGALGARLRVWDCCFLKKILSGW
jgi:hypothetical protein